jgi:hypothetical protein
MSANRYPGPCVACGTRVQAGRGTLEKQGSRFAVRCAACAPSAPARVVPLPAHRAYQRRGRCEDAPCCGCCDAYGSGGMVGGGYDW